MSDLAMRMKKKEREDRNYGALIGQQYNVDMMCLALNDIGFGLCRIESVLRRAEMYSEYFSDCMSYTSDSDALFEKLDNRLKFICRKCPEKFIPRELRYPHLAVPDMTIKFKADPIGVMRK